MPYEDDQVFADLEQRHKEALARVAAENDRWLREKLRTEFNVPPEFEEVAVRIWWDGKEN